MKKAEAFFKKSLAFTGKSHSNQNKKAWIQDIGVYWYYSLALAEFDPCRALVIFDNPAHVIAEAWVTKMAHEYIER